MQIDLRSQSLNREPNNLAVSLSPVCCHVACHISGLNNYHIIAALMIRASTHPPITDPPSPIALPNLPNTHCFHNAHISDMPLLLYFLYYAIFYYLLSRIIVFGVRRSFPDFWTVFLVPLFSLFIFFVFWLPFGTWNRWLLAVFFFYNH